MGVIASIALIPVCNGVSTDCLSITHGAILSTGYDSDPVIVSPPSIGFPIPSITLPRYCLPTGIEKT
jgi:hypothetical protein